MKSRTQLRPCCAELYKPQDRLGRQREGLRPWHVQTFTSSTEQRLCCEGSSRCWGTDGSPGPCSAPPGTFNKFSPADELLMLSCSLGSCWCLLCPDRTTSRLSPVCCPRPGCPQDEEGWIALPEKGSVGAESSDEQGERVFSQSLPTRNCSRGVQQHGPEHSLQVGCQLWCESTVPRLRLLLCIFVWCDTVVS